MALSKDAILKHASDVHRKEVKVPEWTDETGDCTVIVRGMTVKEWEIHQILLSREADDKAPKGEANARMVARCVIDEEGRPLFAATDVNAIANLSLGSILKLQTAITEASGLGDEAEADARGESEPSTSDNSSSA